jgi:hypothetical protein
LGFQSSNSTFLLVSLEKSFLKSKNFRKNISEVFNFFSFLYPITFISKMNLKEKGNKEFKKKTLKKLWNSAP